MAKAAAHVIISAILEEIKHGKRSSEIFKIINKRFGTKNNLFYKYFKQAEDDYFKANRRLKKKIEDVDTILALESHKRDIMRSDERKEYLTSVIRGKVSISKKIVINGVIDEIEVSPDHKDRLSAIAELNKMEGDYAPAKSIVTVTKVGLDAIEEKYE